MFVFRKANQNQASHRSRAGSALIKKEKGGKNATLKKLRAFLDAEEPQTIEWLVSVWENQQAAITYKELKEIALNGWIFDEQLFKWQIDYTALINEKFMPQWETAMAAAAKELQKQYPYFLYDPSVGAAETYIKEHGAELVTNLIAEQRDALQAMISQSVYYDNMTAGSLARIMRPVIGLAEPQARANLNYWAAAWQSGIDVGLTSKAAEKRAYQLAENYAAKQHRYRAQNIARTELAMAYNAGHDGAIRDAIDRGYIGDCKKVWLTADDERVCPICGILEGESRNIDDPFSNGVEIPPAHPSCRCALAYEEISPSLLTNGADNSIIDSGGERMDTGAFEWVGTFDEEQKIKFFGGKTKAALFDAGLLSKDDYFKPLKDIDLNGIIIPDKMAMNHSIVGEYIYPSKDYKNGRLKGGGHTVEAMDEMKRRGIHYNVVRTGNNGVIFGNVPGHDKKFKQSGEKQTWFPQTWTEHDIRVAGIVTANKGIAFNNYAKEYIYKDINIHVLFENGRISSVSPSYDQP